MTGAGLAGTRALAVLAGLAIVAACRQQPAPSPEPTVGPGSPAPVASAVPAPSASDTPAPLAGGSPASQAAPDLGALDERRDPVRVLRFYAAALAAGDWARAARAWRSHSGVTGATLRASYDRGAPVTLGFGKGDAEGGAGSIYYEVPVTLRFGGGAPQQGTLTLRRVNDVDGATPEQLAWRIEQSTIGATQ